MDLKWTQEEPKKPGYYWVRIAGCNHIVKVMWNDTEDKLVLNFSYVSILMIANEIEGWAGPIPEPTEDQKCVTVWDAIGRIVTGIAHGVREFLIPTLKGKKKER